MRSTRLKDQLTEQEMHAADLLVKGWKHQEAADESGLGLSTLRRRIADPTFLAYMDKLREARHKGLIKPAQEKMYELGNNFNPKKDGLEFFLKMSRDPQVPARDQIVAMKAALDLTLAKVDLPGAEPDAKPDVYKASWMTN